jgi:hypothetical protein
MSEAKGCWQGAEERGIFEFGGEGGPAAAETQPPDSFRESIFCTAGSGCAKEEAK